jgi:hypothetical protein
LCDFISWHDYGYIKDSQFVDGGYKRQAVDLLSRAFNLILIPEHPHSQLAVDPGDDQAVSPQNTEFGFNQIISEHYRLAEMTIAAYIRLWLNR